MIKNGLFLCSIGLLVFIFSVNPESLEYNFVTMGIAVTLIVLGGFLFFKGRKRERSKTKDDTDET
ncbi:MAG: DUF3188 domain-containing protein [Oscillospiraceae bacterium]|nr:DUF3188 domain-containing protein [Oscillospiraceae bacterium]